jgi:selenocysteine lyase/cysteine desulfurase
MTPGCAAAGFDAEALKREFSGLAALALPCLDSAATAQMSEPVLAAFRRFAIDGRVNVYGGVHRRARAALAACDEARAGLAPYNTDTDTDALVEVSVRLIGREGAQTRRRRSARPELVTWE